MYVAPSVVVEAQRELWTFLCTALRQAGIAEVPEKLDEQCTPHEAWLDPHLLLAQTCGFPFVKHLKGRVRLVATPVYDAPGCEGPAMCSVIVTRTVDAPASLAACKGLRVAINEPGSNSGYNLLRAAVAPLSAAQPFFSDVVETGGHLASMLTVQQGRADLAAIDCITFDLLRRHAPERLDGLSILAETPAGPALPFITRSSASNAEVAALRAALKAAMTAPDLAGPLAVLGLSDVVVLEEGAYDILLEHERSAVAAGYPSLP